MTAIGTTAISTTIKNTDVFLIAGTVRIDDLKAFLARIREIAERTGVSVQGFNAKKIGGKRHIFYAVERALDAFEKNENEAKDRGLEIMRFASGQRQIEKAFSMGLCEGETDCLFVLTGKDGTRTENAIEEVAGLIAEKDFDDVVDPVRNKRFVTEQFGITEKEIAAAYPGDAETENMTQDVEKRLLEDLIMERTALVGYIK